MMNRRAIAALLIGAGIGGLSIAGIAEKATNGVRSFPRIAHRSSKGRKRTTTAAQQKRNKIKRKNKAGK